MRLAATCLFLPAWVCAANGFPAREVFSTPTPAPLKPRNSDNATRFDTLPPCAQHCVATNCLLDANNESCFCSGNTDLRVCLGNECAILFDALAGRRYWAETCNEPVRDYRPVFRPVMWTTWALATVFVALRLLSRMRAFCGVGYYWDDWLVSGCYMLSLGTIIGGEIALQNGMATDMYTLTVHQIQTFLKLFYLGEMSYNSIAIGLKIAIIALYLRIWSVDVAAKSFRRLCWGIIGLLITTSTAFLFAVIFQCTPVSYVWTYITGADGHCVQLTTLTYVFGALGIIYDVVVFVLPIPNLLNLNVPMSRKLTACGLFLVGFIVTVCSIVRLKYLSDLESKSNASWSYRNVGLWSYIELHLLLVCACIPGTSSLLVRLSKRFHNRNLTDPSGLAPSSGRQNSEVLADEKKSEHSLAELLTDREDTARSMSDAAFPGDTCPPSIRLSRDLRLGSNKVEINYQASSVASEATFTYKDGHGIVHWVTVTDVPSEGVKTSGQRQDTRDDVPMSLSIRDNNEFDERMSRSGSFHDPALSRAVI